MRLIDADAYKSRLIEVIEEIIKDKPGDAYAAGIGRAIYILSNEPTVDAISVVRCRVCEYWSKTQESKHSPGCYRCGLLGGYTSGESYCPDGVREEISNGTG